MSEKIEIGKYYLDKNGNFGDKIINDEGGTEGVLIYCFGEISYEEWGNVVLPYDDLDYNLVNLKSFLGVQVYPFIASEGFGSGIRWITTYKENDIVVRGCESESFSHQWIPIDPLVDIKDRFQKTSCFIEMERQFFDHMTTTYKHLYKNEIVRAKEVYKI